LTDSAFTSGLLPKLPADLFYPLTIQSDTSGASYLAALSVAVVGLMMMLLF
jgi:hypothetical protein